MEPLILPAKLESLSKIRAFVRDAAAAAGLDEPSTYAMSLAIDEIATNIMTHGYAESGSDGWLEARAETSDEGLTILIEDGGQPYDPKESMRVPERNEPLECRPLGGLGVYLAVQSVDRFQYDCLGDRNRHTLFVRRRDRTTETQPAEDGGSPQSTIPDRRCSE